MSLSECYCVDVNTGVEYPGTRSQGMGTFDCDYAGNVFSIVDGNGQRCGQQVLYVWIQVYVKVLYVVKVAYH